METGHRDGAAINWYRSPVAPQDLKCLLRRSDLRGWTQTAGYLAVLCMTAFLAMYSYLHEPWWMTLSFVFLHGMVAAFLINGVHELNHATVFKSALLNRAFANLFAFLGWINHDVYLASHVRHHRYTLHPPDDMEVVLPLSLSKRDFFMTGFVNVRGFAATIADTWRWAQGGFAGDWELRLYPADAPDSRAVPIRWARILLAGHAAILAMSAVYGIWIIPLIVSVPRFYGGWLFYLCNNTQHVALRDNVADFRLCCRSFTLNRLVEFLYWHMNYHTEHHMYPGVPCYNLAELHRRVRGDMPACAHGLASVWREIRHALAS